LHTHGLHISGDGNADDVTRYVEFNHQLHYVWDLSKGNHMGGTYWYHAHHHGETYNQVNFGALGMLIVNDDFDSLLPAGLTNSDRIKTFLSNEKTLFAHYVAQNTIFGTWFGNGETGTQIDVVDGEWTRFRVAVAHAQASRMGLQITAVSNGGANPCVMHVIAHDGVYLNQVPSDQVSETTVTSASRVDLALRCLSPGAKAQLKVAFQVVATINVVAGSPLDADPFESGGTPQKWPPLRPDYLRDLRNEPVFASNKHSITLTSGDVNGKAWDAAVPLANLNYDQVQEFTIYDSGPHPFHMHLYHMQIVSPEGCGNFDYGEWYDTISTPGPCLVRFKTADIGQRFVMHCHIIEHSDMGSMGWMDVIGGPSQPNQNPGVGQEPIGTIMATRQRRRKLRGKQTI
jgi:FtsP/CotA-like multicopper oxidase with cupredoxin domain